jgi:hypothetical protein
MQRNTSSVTIRTHQIDYKTLLIHEMILHSAEIGRRFYNSEFSERTTQPFVKTLIGLDEIMVNFRFTRDILDHTIYTKNTRFFERNAIPDNLLVFIPHMTLGFNSEPAVNASFTEPEFEHA